MKYFRIKAPNLAIDLGTANSQVAIENKGIVIDEPTVVALEVKTGEIVSIGQAAKEMIGKTPENIVAIMPLEDGVVTDFDIAQMLLNHYIKKALKGISVIQPRVIITVPSSATDVENRAIEDACLQAGARDVYLVEETIASAVGAGLPVDKPQGNMIVNIGAGTSEVAVVSLYGIVTSKTIGVGGDDLNALINAYIKEKYLTIIGPETAEKLKVTIGTLKLDKQNNRMEIGGRDLFTGMPKNIDVFASDITDAISETMLKIVDAIRHVLENTPPELSAEIIKNGITMTGGMSKFDGLKELIESEINIPAKVSETASRDAINGAMKILSNIKSINVYRKR